MIETRYDIEYVSPNGKTKSGLGRFFAYLLLLITLLVFLAALIFSNLSDSASQLVTQKIQQLTGINTETITNTTSINNDVANDDSTAESNEDEKAEETSTASKLADETHKADQKALASAKDENEKNKKELKRLSQENTKQSEASKKQQLDNQRLNKDLERITKQLAKEKKASDQLAKKLETLNIENNSLTKELAGSKKALASEKNKKVATPFANEPKKAEPKTVEKIETPKAVTVGRTDKLKEESVKTEEPAKPKPVVVTQETINPNKNTSNKTATPEKTKAPLSQMDAIVEAMKAAKK